MKKNLLQRFIATLLLLAITTISWAYDFEVDGIYYNRNADGTNVTVTSISYFSGSYSGSITIPSQVTYNSKTYNVISIGTNAFYGCSGLTSVTIPNSVTSIGERAFIYCSSLTSVAIPNSVTSIGNDAFHSCSGLTSIDIPQSITTIGYGAFDDTAWYNNQPEGLVYAGKVVYKYKGTMPNETSITLDEGTLGIAGSAFDGCSGLVSIEIPNSVTSIGERAFSYCSSLTSVSLNSNDIVSKTYSYESNLNTIFGSQVKEYILGNDVTSIGRYAFYNCAGLTSITIPNSVTSIGSYAFRGCSSLTSLTIGNSVTEIGNSVFYGCSGLTSVTIPNSVTNIGSYAFYGCSSLTSVIIPNSVISIGGDAFSDTPWYNNQPDGIVYIGKVIYRYKGTMPEGTHITLKEGTLEIAGSAFSGCTGLTSIDIPNSVTSISESVFSNCSNLASVTIPNSVTSIGADAFFGCTSLTSVTIPNSVTSIVGGYAFYGCPLQTIINRGENNIEEDSFSKRVYLHTQLYVPEGTVWDYIFNTRWGEFHHIKEFASNADDIRNDAVYMIADQSGRNFPVYNQMTKSLRNEAYTLNLDDNDTGTCWQVIEDGGDTYLYNIGAGMYAEYDAENNLSLSKAPVAVDIKVTEVGTTINGKPVMLVANKSVAPVEAPKYILGDANVNCEVEIGDVTSVLTLMATPEVKGYNKKAADANGNGEIEIGDVTTILTIMAKGGE